MNIKRNDKLNSQPYLVATSIPKPYFSTSTSTSNQFIPYHFSTVVEKQEGTGIPVKLKAHMTPRSRDAKKAVKPTNLAIYYDEKRQKTSLDVDSRHEELVVVYNQQGHIKFNSIFGSQTKSLTPTKKMGIVVEPGDIVAVFDKELYQQLNVFRENQQVNVQPLVDRLLPAASPDAVSQQVWRAAIEQQHTKKPAIYQDIILLVDHLIKKEIFVKRPSKLTIRDFIATFPAKEQTELQYDLQRQGYKLDSAQDLYRLWISYSNFIPEVNKGLNTHLPLFYSQRVRNKLQNSDYIKGKNIEYFVNFYIKNQFSYSDTQCVALLRAFKALGYNTTSPKDLERLARRYQLQNNEITHQSIWESLPVGRKTTEKFLRFFLSDMIDLTPLANEYDRNEAKSDSRFLRELTGTDYSVPCEQFLDAIYHPQLVNACGASLIVCVPDFRFTELLRALVENQAVENGAHDDTVLLSKVTAALAGSDNIIKTIDEALHTLSNEKIYDEAQLLAVGKKVLLAGVQAKLAGHDNTITLAGNDAINVKQLLDDRVHNILGKACNPFNAEKFNQKHRNPIFDSWTGITLTATTKKVLITLSDQLLSEWIEAVDQVKISATSPEAMRAHKVQLLKEAKHHWLFANNYSPTWTATGYGRTAAMKILDDQIVKLQAPIEPDIMMSAERSNIFKMSALASVR